MNRRLYLDWLRGLAVVLMILWHSVDSWSVTDGRESLAFWFITFLAGWVAPAFLFLAGVSVSLAASSRMRRGADRRRASRMLQNRGWQIFLLAHLFRFQSFLLNPSGSWSGLLKPDILNVLGLGMVAAAWCWERAERWPTGPAVWLGAPALVIVTILTPLSRQWWWPTLLHPRIEAYIRPVGNFGVFSLFPIVAYLFIGTLVGMFLVEGSERDATTHQRLGLAGGALGAIGLAVSRQPWAVTPTWADTLSLFFWRIGVLTAAVALSWALFRRRQPRPWSPLVTFGQASLMVYWVHVELAYGVFSSPIRHALPLPWALFGWFLLTLFMWGAAVAWLKRPQGQPWIPRHMAAA